MKLKYVMFNTSVGKLPVIFPDVIMHSDMARAVRLALRNVSDECEPVSAGFINMSTGECYGKSESLKLEVDVADTEFIYERFF